MVRSQADAAPVWSKGFPVPWLKAAAAIFREEFKAHTYGAFGIPKERDIADARANDWVVWKSSGRKPIEGVAIAPVLKSASTHTDFAGREIKLHAGDVFVKAIAGDVFSKRNLLQWCVAHCGPNATVWVEGHVENAELVKVLELEKYALIMTKISASSDLKGLWVYCNEPGMRVAVAPPALDPADEASLSIVQHKFMSQTQKIAILQEILRAGAAAWAQHYSGYNKGRSWTSFALQGYDPADPHFIIKPAEMSKDWKKENAARLAAPCVPTAAAKNFPTAMAIVDAIPGRKQRVRLMRLAAGGGELTRHSDITDREAGTKDGAIARLHIPIATDPRCLFRSWDLGGRERRVHIPERALAYLDTRKPHAVINPSDIERIHLVVDVYSSPELRAMIAA